MHGEFDVPIRYECGVGSLTVNKVLSVLLTSAQRRVTGKCQYMSLNTTLSLVVGLRK